MKIAITPAAQREAERRKIDIRQIHPTGVGGYVQLRDVQHYSARPDAAGKRRVTSLAREIARCNRILIDDVPAQTDARVTKADVLLYLKRKTVGREIPHSEMRRVIARRMTKSISEAPQYTMFGEYDVTALFDSLRGYAERMRASGEVKPTFTDVLIYFAARALQSNDILNSTYSEDKITIHPHINVGIAVALEDGLIVPNIKHADEKILPEITKERAILVQKARKGRLAPDDYSGGTFTITNLGQYPVQFSTPIINQPESAILGVGMITEKPVVYRGKIEIRKMLSISLTCDHRHIDGATAAGFLLDFSRLLEQPLTSEQMCNSVGGY